MDGAVIDAKRPLKPMIGGAELDPDEQSALEEREREAAAIRADTLDKLGVALAGSRSKAMEAREASGIERDWQEDEEHYEGIDDANRGERKSLQGKPPGNTGQNDELGTATSSTVFINITRPYVDAASARVADMLLPTDDRPWSLKPTPIPELASMAEGKFPQHILKQAAAANPGAPDIAKQQLHQAVEDAVAAMNDAKEKAERAEKRIEDWHTQCQWHAEVRKVIEDAAKIGVGILKGPVPVKQKQVAFVDGKLILREEIQPASYCISPWNFYPDGACGEKIHSGSHAWERDDITRRGLEDLKGAPGYLDDQIDLVIEEGALKASRVAPDRPLPDGSTPDKSGMFEIWYYTGSLEREHLEACGCEVPKKGNISVPAQVTMVNNRVIKAIVNPIDTGALPYDVMVWQKKAGHWAGIGVSRQIRTPQEIVVGAGRNLMDNAGIAGGPQLVIQQGVVAPHDGVYAVTPWKVWLAGSEADMANIDKAFRFVTIPMLQVELMAIIQLGLKLAEDVTGLPLLLQGQQGGAPDTLGGLQIMNNNSSTVLRRLARLFDDLITEPHVRRYYAYLLIYGEDNEKGDFQIDARGSSALVQRDVENQAVGEMANIVSNPIFGVDPKKWFAEWCKSKHLDVRRFQFDDDKWRQIVENMGKGQQDPRLAVAQLKADTEAKIIQLEQAFEAAENDKDRQLDLMLKAMDSELGQQGLTVEAKKSLESAKAKLADTVIKIRAQAQMQRGDHAMQMLNPPVEPAGRAKSGEAFIQ